MLRLLRVAVLVMLIVLGAMPVFAQTTPIPTITTFLPFVTSEQTAVPTSAPLATPTPDTPAPSFEFNIAIASSCEPQAAGTWFSGKTYKNGVPADGYRVVFSFAADGPLATEPIISGPHEGYSNWDTGYYSHIISANEPISGTWYAWIIDADDIRISEMASFTTDGPDNTCNQAVVDFDSR